MFEWKLLIQDVALIICKEMNSEAQERRLLLRLQTQRLLATGCNMVDALHAEARRKRE